MDEADEESCAGCVSIDAGSFVVKGNSEEASGGAGVGAAITGVAAERN